jgi:hypothetical protein
VAAARPRDSHETMLHAGRWDGAGRGGAGGLRAGRQRHGHGKPDGESQRQHLRRIIVHLIGETAGMLVPQALSRNSSGSPVSTRLLRLDKIIGQPGVMTFSNPSQAGRRPRH